jgi:hypothetical protein
MTGSRARRAALTAYDVRAHSARPNICVGSALPRPRQLARRAVWVLMPLGRLRGRVLEAIRPFRAVIRLIATRRETDAAARSEGCLDARHARALQVPERVQEVSLVRDELARPRRRRSRDEGGRRAARRLGVEERGLLQHALRALRASRWRRHARATRRGRVDGLVAHAHRTLHERLLGRSRREVVVKVAPTRRRGREDAR